MRRSSRRNRRTVYVEVGTWFDERDRSIHLATQELPNGHIRVTNDPSKVNGHPQLFDMLAKLLHKAGAPGPHVEVNEDTMSRRDMVAALYGLGVSPDVLSDSTDEEIKGMYRRARGARFSNGEPLMPPRV